MRSRAEENEETALMMRALRGQNMNDDDRQVEGVSMRIVEMRKGEAELPVSYEPEKLAEYFRARPGAVASRIGQIATTSAGLVSRLALDALLGRLEEREVERAAELRRTIVSLGPFFIKLGQALSIRPDILSPRSMVELQQLCDKVPSFDSELAFATIRDELGASSSSLEEIFRDITPEPVAAASLGQVYKATLRDSDDVVAVKVQRPFVLETVSLDLYLARELGKLWRKFAPEDFGERLDIVALLDEFASRFYDELDYNIECANGERVARDMRKLPRVVIPKNYPRLTTRRVHVAEWVEGEKLSQSKADDVQDLVNLGVVTYLTQLLDTGFFHADPHPGNMLRAPDGRLVILDFGLMTEITPSQKYGMIEAISHLIHRDYDRIGQDFKELDFIPPDADVEPIVPALSRVFDAALSGGGAKAVNFNDLAADLADITFNFPFRIPPYFALIIRAIGVLEGIALVGNPDFAIVDEAWPYISRRLLTDPSPRMRAALKYMVYGRSRRFDVDRMIDMLLALEKFVAVKAVATDALASSPNAAIVVARPADQTEASREALRFFFAKDGALFRDFLTDEIVASLDAATRAVSEARRRRRRRPAARGPVDAALAKLAPPLDDDDLKSLANARALLAFLLDARSANANPDALAASTPLAARALLPLLVEHADDLRLFATQVAARLAEKQVGRTFDVIGDLLLAPAPRRA
ncbi:hypothetical protein CTAYLR_006314 [Chrysophaeum taylorii]|uniref:Protein kinase domain-containing protein n=1 Tax=Chrysophaeum taylorii TaxID=2483200 RepID=A0AAD7XGV7_9STRA|nr:hypothetical protein CTAYLR_006314 [Chrysophaeum taylorii]